MDVDAEKLALMRLARVEGLGPIRLRRLMDAFGSASAVLKASPRQTSEVTGIGEKIAQAIASAPTEESLREELARMESLGVRVLMEADEEYPASLREIYDPPVLLTIKGSIELRDKIAVAIVGSRRSTRYGTEQAYRFASALAARGITIVSGLARGIDAAAHRGAIEAGGRTIAVLASGLDNIYPPEHRELAELVAKQGAVVSEAPLDGPPLAGLFPLRNRIISGMSLGVLVIEAADRSGALSTAHHALEQNRDVFALPGRLTDITSQGTNRLIQQGAFVPLVPEDLVNRLGPVEVGAASPSGNGDSLQDRVPDGLSEIEHRLWEHLGSDEVALDLLVERAELPPSQISAALLTLELRRHVERLPGGLFRKRRSS